MKNVLLIACLTLAASLACGKTEPLASGFSGRVVETTNAAGYTYVLVDTGTNKLWAAAPQFTVKPGDAVAVAQGMSMPNYHSKTLNRDFDAVYFTGSITLGGERSAAAPQMNGLPKHHPPIGGPTMGLPKDHPSIGGQAPPAKWDLAGIKKAEGGNTIQEVFADKARLTGKPVKVRGRVVKFNAMILGKNWLHIQDGTGKDGSNDLTVTTAAEAKVGDMVLVTGTLVADKDFGAGYKYALLVEDAKLIIDQDAAH